MRYVPYHELRGPNLIVDGPPTDGTVLTLSHWPSAPTPAPLRADLSAQIVFKYLGSPRHHVDVDTVSNNHFDEDGLVCVYAILKPLEAQARQPFLIDVAWTGDFQIFRSRESARVAFTLNAYANPDRSPLGASLFKGPYAPTCAALYTECLAKLPEMIAHPDRFRPLWEEDDAFLARSFGHVRVEEFPDIDLAVVRGNFHPCAVHSATSRFRVARVDGARYEFQYRYESWVRYVSRRVPPRVDLTPLCDRLNDLEPGWEWEGIEQTTPRLLRPDGSESRLSPEAWLAMLGSSLR